MQRTEEQQIKTIGGTIFTLLFPFFSCLAAFLNLKSRNAYIAIALFYLLFGLAFNPVNEAADSYRYAEDFISFARDPEGNLSYAFDTYFGDNSSDQDEFKDVYIYVMYYLAAKIGGTNVHVLFFLFSVVFTFFALKSLTYITRNSNYRNCLPMYILLFLFIYSNNIFNINGVRFWTASWIAVYLTFKILIDRKFNYALLLPILPLVHASYIIYVAFVVLAYLVRRNVPVLCKIYIISFFFGEIGLTMLEYVNDFMPGYIQRMIWSYTESEWGQSRIDGTEDAKEALYARILFALPRYYELILLFLASRKYKSFKNKQFLGFTLAYFSLFNICAMIPSMGRYYLVGYPFIIYIWVNEYQSLKCYNKYLYLAPAVYAYTVFRWVRSVASVTDASLYISNVFHIIYNAFAKQP